MADKDRAAEKVLSAEITQLRTMEEDVTDDCPNPSKVTVGVIIVKLKEAFQGYDSVLIMHVALASSRSSRCGGRPVRMDGFYFPRFYNSDNYNPWKGGTTTTRRPTTTTTPASQREIVHQGGADEVNHYLQQHIKNLREGTVENALSAFTDNAIFMTPAGRMYDGKEKAAHGMKKMQRWIQRATTSINETLNTELLRDTDFIIVAESTLTFAINGLSKPLSRKVITVLTRGPPSMKIIARGIFPYGSDHYLSENETFCIDDSFDDEETIRFPNHIGRFYYEDRKNETTLEWGQKLLRGALEIDFFDLETAVVFNGVVKRNIKQTSTDEWNNFAKEFGAKVDYYSKRTHKLVIHSDTDGGKWMVLVDSVRLHLVDKTPSYDRASAMRIGVGPTSSRQGAETAIVFQAYFQVHFFTSQGWMEPNPVIRPTGRKWNFIDELQKGNIDIATKRHFTPDIVYINPSGSMHKGFEAAREAVRELDEAFKTNSKRNFTYVPEPFITIGLFLYDTGEEYFVTLSQLSFKTSQQQDEWCPVLTIWEDADDLTRMHVRAIFPAKSPGNNKYLEVKEDKLLLPKEAPINVVEYPTSNAVEMLEELTKDYINSTRVFAIGYQFIDPQAYLEKPGGNHSWKNTIIEYLGKAKNYRMAELETLAQGRDNGLQWRAVLQLWGGVLKINEGENNATAVVRLFIERPTSADNEDEVVIFDGYFQPFYFQEGSEKDPFKQDRSAATAEK